MKVILISGSPRPKGNTMLSLQTCVKVLEEEGLEAKIVSLAGKTIRSCVACGACNRQGFCVLEDDFAPIEKEVREAEGLIVGAPVYFGTARGEMMSLLQRLGKVAFANDHYLSGKIGGPVAVGRRGGHTATIQEMLMFYFINGMTVPGATYWNMVFGGPEGEALEDEEGQKTLQNFAANVAKLIKLQYGK